MSHNSTTTELVAYMSRHSIGTVLCIVISALLAQAEDARPIMKEPRTNLVNCIESIARGNLAAARVSVAHDAAQNRVRIFAVAFGGETGDFKEGGYNVEIIYNVNIAVEAKVGVVSYQYQHNCQVLEFAAAQFAVGKKTLGRRLVRFLAKAQPDLFWSSPPHPAMTIEMILAGLEKDDKSVEAFLKDEMESWAETVSMYGPSRSSPKARGDGRSSKTE
jgi:hypothetical protein